MEKIIRSGESFHLFKKRSPTIEFPTLFTEYIKSFGETYFWEKGNFHIVTKSSHAREILKSDAYSADRGAFFISRMPNMDLSLIQGFFGVVKKMMVMSDDQDHLDKRRLAGIGFDDQIIAKFKNKINETVNALVDEFKNHKEIDFVEHVSKKLPAIVLADLFCIPNEDREMFYKWSNTMTGFFGGASEYRNEDGIAVNEAALSLKNYFDTLIDKRTLKPGQDYVSLVLSHQDKFSFSKDDIISQLIMMLVAGMATTTDQINNSMLLIANDSKLQKELRDNLDLIPRALEELKRFDPAVTFIFRIARKETMIGNQPVKKGEVIFISTHAINRDLDESLRPNEIDIFREQNHFAYGFGPHYCIGAKLAREEMQTLFRAIFEKWPEFKLNENKESIRDHYSLSFSGFKELHLKFN